MVLHCASLPPCCDKMSVCEGLDRNRLSSLFYRVLHSWMYLLAIIDFSKRLSQRVDTIKLKLEVAS